MSIPDYADAIANFRVEDVAALFDGDLEKGINACYECCDRHVAPGKVALQWEGKDGDSATYTFAQLKELSAKFANYLVSRGVKPGDRVAGLMPRVPELLVVILGTWRAGAVYQPLFTAFGPKAIEYRLDRSEAKLVVTDSVNRSKLDDVNGCPPVLTVVRSNATLTAGDADFWAEVDKQSTEFAPVMLRGDDLCMMLFTSGTTGLAKGVPVPIKALMGLGQYMRQAVDLRDDDIYWNIADPGWAYGLYFGVTGPLLQGHATTFYDGPFTVESTYRMIEKYKITNLAGAPTAYRLLIAAGEQAALPVKGKLRVVSSAGEPLNPEVIRWFEEHLACPIYDHYGQTEIAMVVCNHHALKHHVQPGSAGFALPGYRVAVVVEEGGEAVELPPGKPGILAVDRSQSPLFWFPGYWQQDTKSFVGPYYLTGDTVELNDDGSISFVGRSDDIITSSGYRIGPFDVESCLIEHEAVMETAVVGKPDPERTELVKAFVILRDGYKASPELAEELQMYVKHRLAAHAYPREIEFVAELPKTPSGKIQRFLLRKQEAEKVNPPAQHS